MNATAEILEHRRRQASARFFLRVGQAGEAAAPRDEHTLPLFPLPLIMDAEGVLADEARHLVDAEADYLRHCRAAIESVSLEMA